MRALLAAVGTRGDVQPALALAVELRKLGHAVRLCISPNFVEWARSLGLEAVPMGVEMRMPASKSGADGQVAWSWPPDAEVKPAEMISRRRGQQSPVPGESTYKP